MGRRATVTAFDRVATKDARTGIAVELVVETILAPAADDVAVHVAITGSSSVVLTITAGITDPVEPRCIDVDPGGTLTDVPGATFTINGTDIEDNVISEEYTLIENDGTLIAGTKAFKTVTSIVVPVCDGAASTYTVQTSDILGLTRRLQGPVIQSQVDASSNGTFADDAGTLTTDIDDVELNTYLPADVPDGTSDYRLMYVTQDIDG